MINSYKKEVECFDKVRNVNKKVFVLALYNEFYNKVINSIDGSYKNYYELFMETTFCLISDVCMLSKSKNISPDDIMHDFFRLLKRNVATKPIGVSDIIDEFENNLDQYKRINEYANVIDKFDATKSEAIKLSTKTRIMTQYREYINNLYARIDDLYGIDECTSLKYEILDLLCNELKVYLKEAITYNMCDADIIDNLNPILMDKTKNILMKKLKKKSSDLYRFPDDVNNLIISKLTDVEKKLWLSNHVYYISGYEYNMNTKNEKQRSDRINEICDFVNISPLEYLSTLAIMSEKIVEVYKDLSDDKLTFENNRSNSRKRKKGQN